MNSNETTTKRRRRLDFSTGEAAAAADATRDDAVSRLERRINLMEASFQRDISEMKRADEDLLARNKVVESQLSSLKDEIERLNAKVSQLHDKNCRLEAAFRAHVGNMDWKYDAPDPPSDRYWIEQGYEYDDDEDTTDQDYIDCVNDDFFQRAKDQSEKLRCGTFGLAPGDDIEDLHFGAFGDDVPRIRYDRALLPHWVEFCDSLFNWQVAHFRGTIERTHPFCVNICNIELPSNVIKLLRKCFERMNLGHVEDLGLSRNNFQGSNGINFAIEIMRSQKKLRQFCYELNPVDNDQDCQRLVDAIVSHPRLPACHLNGLCRGEINGHDYLVHLLRKDGMMSIGFASCAVSTNGRSTLFDLVKLHPNLVWLGLNDNKLDDKDAIHLANALRHNRTLEGLTLRRNELTRLGEDILKKAIYDDSSLNAVADSNHVCTILGLSFTTRKGYSLDYQGWRKYNVYYNRNTSVGDEDGPKLSRARKIFHFLGTKGKEGQNCLSLEAGTGGVALKVVPLALAAVQIYGKQWSQGTSVVTINDNGEHGAAELSITYELLQRWNVTVLCHSRLNNDQ